MQQYVGFSNWCQYCAYGTKMVAIELSNFMQKMAVNVNEKNGFEC